MKIDKQLAITTQVDPRIGTAQIDTRVDNRGQSGAEVQRAPGHSRQLEAAGREHAPRHRESSKRSGYNLQLNRQLTAMQSADSYLADVAARLDQLKLTLSRQLATPRDADQPALQKAVAELSRILAERSSRSGGSLDSNLKLSLNEPARNRFRLAGLDSIEALQAAGDETLIINAGRKQSEPAIVTLSEGLHPEQVLRRFNTALAPVGIRTELDSQGQLVFTSRDADWQKLQAGVGVQGEGGLFEYGHFTLLQPQEESFLEVDKGTPLDTSGQQRQALDRVVKALDKITVLREQLSQRKQEIREFLARQDEQDDREWAAGYVQSVFGLMQKSSSDYMVVTQTVVAQANLNRFAVVSLLS